MSTVNFNVHLHCLISLKSIANCKVHSIESQLRKSSLIHFKVMVHFEAFNDFSRSNLKWPFNLLLT